MRKLLMERGRGKTTAMVYTSAATGVPILCPSRQQGSYIKSKANGLGVQIPEPLYLEDDFRGRRVESVLVDDAEQVLSGLVKKAIGADLVAFTMSYDSRKSELEECKKFSDAIIKEVVRQRAVTEFNF